MPRILRISSLAFLINFAIFFLILSLYFIFIKDAFAFTYFCRNGNENLCSADLPRFSNIQISCNGNQTANITFYWSGGSYKLRRQASGDGNCYTMCPTTSSPCTDYNVPNNSYLYWLRDSNGVCGRSSAQQSVTVHCDTVTPAPTVSLSTFCAGVNAPQVHAYFYSGAQAYWITRTDFAINGYLGGQYWYDDLSVLNNGSYGYWVYAYDSTNTIDQSGRGLGPGWSAPGFASITAANCAPTNPAPIGYIETADCTVATGWACDGSDYSQPINVAVYADSIYQGSVSAGTPRSDLGAVCGGNINHAWSFTIPDNLKDNTPHAIYPYGIDIPTAANNPLLSNAPKTITCAPPSGTLFASPNPCTIPKGGSMCSSTISWTTTNTPFVSNINVYADGALFANGAGPATAPWINTTGTTFTLKYGNTLLSTLAVSGVLYPDLNTSINAFLSPVEGTPISFSGTVTNSGGGNDTQNTSTRFCIDNASCYTSAAGLVGTDIITPAIPGNSSTSVSTSSPWTSVVGPHTLYLCADVGLVVTEYDDSSASNCSSYPFTVKANPNAWIQTQVGDVHSNININTIGGP